MTTASLGPRQGGWQRPVSVPEDLSLLRGPVTGQVRLPLHVYSSGRGTARVFDLADESQLVELYQIVLTDGRVEDVCRFIDAVALGRLWPRLWLSEHVRRAWQPLLAAAAR